MEPRKLTKKEEKERQKQFPDLEEKATIWEIGIMIFWLAMALIMVYLFYLTFTYHV